MATGGRQIDRAIDLRRQQEMGDFGNQARIKSAESNLDGQKSWLDSLDFAPGSTVLDIGCGPGTHCGYFRDRGLIPTGLDRDTAAFQFAGEIEIVQDVSELRERRFDVVFASHVLEHAPNTFEALSAWRELLTPGGRLVLVLPPYVPFVANDHWIVGWNLAQLAMTLVAAGFDCRESRFVETPGNVCGIGVKADIPETRFNIVDSLRFLPTAMQEAHRLYGDNWVLDGDLCVIEPARLVRKPGPTIHVPAFDAAPPSAALGDGETWHDAVVTDIATSNFSEGGTLVVRTDGDAALRLAIGSGVSAGMFSNSIERWDSYRAGVTYAPISPTMFRPLHGEIDLGSIDHVAFGGFEIGASWIEFDLISADGRRIASARLPPRRQPKPASPAQRFIRRVRAWLG